MRIKEIIKEKGLTSKEVASQLGMSGTGFSLMISEGGNPPLKRLKALADILGVSLSELFSDDDENNYFICPNCGQKIKISLG